MPKLTVLMSAYNSEKYIKEAIDSVLSQTFTDFEFIIYEDASTDNTLENIECYNDSRILLIKNTENKGLTKNLHEGMKLASGEYLARMDADDICLPDRFKKQVEFLETNTDISILGTAVIFFDKTGKEILGTQPLTHDEIKVELLLGFTMLHPSIMMRIEDLRKHNLNYDVQFRYSQDFDLWVRASRLLKLANLHEPLVKMREHHLKISHALKPEQKTFSDKIRCKQYNDLEIKLSQKQKEILHNVASGNLLSNNSDLSLFEITLYEIIQCNENINFFNKLVLEKAIHSRLFYQYYTCLLNGNNEGLQFWKSRFNLFWKLGFTFKLKVVIRTLLIKFISSK